MQDAILIFDCTMANPIRMNVPDDSTSAEPQTACHNAFVH
jgi:hypothetical protein